MGKAMSPAPQRRPAAVGVGKPRPPPSAPPPPPPAGYGSAPGCRPPQAFSPRGSSSEAGEKRTDNRRRRHNKEASSPQGAYLPRRLFSIRRRGASEGVPLTGSRGGLDPILEGDEGGRATTASAGPWERARELVRGARGRRFDVLRPRVISASLAPYLHSCSVTWSLVCIMVALAHARLFPGDLVLCWGMACIVSLLQEVLGHQMMQAAVATALRK